ncbi:MAG: site-2 protease family protein [Sandaracinaceae bacterium]|nr:site-2 protease family protein [Sandaracinaceae bacterium]
MSIVRVCPSMLASSSFKRRGPRSLLLRPVRPRGRACLDCDGLFEPLPACAGPPSPGVEWRTRERAVTLDPVQREPHFHFFGVPIYVEPLHFIVSALFGYMQYGASASALVWVLLVFVGVLLHEMGHALVGRRFGQEPFVILSGWGGLTTWMRAMALSPGQQILVSFAGPAVGLALGGGVWIWYTYSPFAATLPPIVANGIHDFIWINFGWAIFNLLPVFPLDGGQMSKATLEKFFGVRGMRWSHLISMIIAIGVVALALPLRAIFLLLMFGQLALLNWQHFQAAGRWIDRVKPAKPKMTATPVAPARGSPREAASIATLDAELQRGWQALEDGRPLMVRMIAESLLLRVETDDKRFEVIHLLAWGRLLGGDARAAKNALSLLPKDKLPDALLEGAVRLELGEAEAAVPLLAEGIRGRSDDFVASRLGKAVASSGRVDPVAKLLEEEKTAKEIGPRAFQLVVADLFAARRYQGAIELGQLLFGRFGKGADAFNVACALGKASRGDEGLVWLEKAIEAGLEDPSVIDTDADLSDVRALPGFQAVREKAGLGSA